MAEDREGEGEELLPPPRVIVREAEPERGVSWSRGGLSEAEARRIGVQVSCGLSFPARRAELGELRRGERLRGRGASDREILGGPMPARAGADEEALVNVWVVVGEELVMFCPLPGRRIVVVGDDSI